jgi:hypothetical protein
MEERLNSKAILCSFVEGDSRSILVHRRRVPQASNFPISVVNRFGPTACDHPDTLASDPEKRRVSSTHIPGKEGAKEGRRGFRTFRTSAIPGIRKISL